MKHFTTQEVIDMIANLSIQSDKNAKAQEENAKAQKKTDEQMRRNEAKLTKLGVLTGNISKNNGAVAEEFFYSSLKKNKKLGSITYYEIGREWKKDLKNMHNYK